MLLMHILLMPLFDFINVQNCIQNLSLVTISRYVRDFDALNILFFVMNCFRDHRAFEHVFGDFPHFLR